LVASTRCTPANGADNDAPVARDDTQSTDEASILTAAVPAATDDAGLQQDTEVLRDVLLRRPGGLAQLAHARLAFAERVEQLDPHRLADDAEAARDQLDQRVGKGLGKVHGDSSIAQLHN